MSGAPYQRVLSGHVVATIWRSYSRVSFSDCFCRFAPRLLSRMSFLSITIPPISLGQAVFCFSRLAGSACACLASCFVSLNLPGCKLPVIYFFSFVYRQWYHPPSAFCWLVITGHLPSTIWQHGCLHARLPGSLQLVLWSAPASSQQNRQCSYSQAWAYNSLPRLSWTGVQCEPNNCYYGAGLLVFLQFSIDHLARHPSSRPAPASFHPLSPLVCLANTILPFPSFLLPCENICFMHHCHHQKFACSCQATIK